MPSSSNQARCYNYIGKSKGCSWKLKGNQTLSSHCQSLGRKNCRPGTKRSGYFQTLTSCILTDTTWNIFFASKFVFKTLIYTLLETYFNCCIFPDVLKSMFYTFKLLKSKYINTRNENKKSLPSPFNHIVSLLPTL